MLKNSTRKIVLAFTLAVLAASTGRAIAQSSTSTTGTSTTTTSPTDPDPGAVSGTDPEPDYVGIVLALLGLA